MVSTVMYKLSSKLHIFSDFCEHELSVSIVVHMFLVLLYSAGKNVEKKCYKNVFTNIDSFFWSYCKLLMFIHTYSLCYYTHTLSVSVGQLCYMFMIKK